MTSTSSANAGLKMLTAKLIDERGGLVACSAATRVSVTSLSNYQNPNHPSFIPIDVLYALEKLPNCLPLVSTHLLSLQGYDAVQRDPAPAADLGQKVAGFWQATSEFSAQHAAAQADGVIDERERALLVPMAQKVALAADEIAGTLA